jgi:hypothetical protein
MKVFKKLTCLFTVTIIFSTIVTAQQQSYFDPAIAYTKLLLDRTGEDGGQQRVGNFKVNGTALFYGTALEGMAYVNGQTVSKSKIKYDTYSQEIEFVASVNDKQMTFKNENIDSFYVQRKNTSGTLEKFMFYSGKYYNQKSKAFFMKLCSTKNYTLLKEYQTGLAIVSTNYIDTDLRQFDLKANYYYVENTIADKKTTSIKLNKVWLKKKLPNYDMAINLAESFDIYEKPDDFLSLLFSNL